MGDARVPSPGRPLLSPTIGARSIFVRGIVQGVGFRPHVHGLATRLGLHGFVQNQAAGVRVEVEGTSSALDAFADALSREAPPLARIDALESRPRSPRGEAGFRIVSSVEGSSRGPVLLSSDIATCGPCLAELFDGRDRRYLHPFINCTDCGPRLTIIKAAPYDRERTTMASFSMCALCRAEYEDPASRRFHAQANACPRCGPRLALLDAAGNDVPAADPLAIAVEALRRGEVVALKGLGGYHFACDATRETAVARLREAKHRHEKPFALMVADVDAAARLAELSAAERALLSSPERPIVLLRRGRGARVAKAVSPGNPLLGIMLAYTPLHHLLLRGMAGGPLVMTSGNAAEEPIAFEDAEARDRLRGIASLFVVHDRAIRVRCDDSVARVIGNVPMLLRRARGHAPRALTLGTPLPRPTLALGGHLKAVFALGQGDRALLSPHIGDLEDHRAFQAYAAAIRHYEALFAIEPAVLVHDLHPDYASTIYARARAADQGLARLAVQHHHAHLASALAEHGLPGPAIGVTFDGSGYGLDGTVWGGEFLLGDCCSFRRAAHLRAVPLAGGEQAVREPWRSALSHLLDAEAADAIGPLFGARIPAGAVGVVRRMFERRLNAPPCSSMGRLFDAVAALAGLRDRTSFEGQAAMELEWLAADTTSDGAYPFDVTVAPDGLTVDTRPLIRAIASESRRAIPADLIARRFHDTVIEIIATVCGRLRETTGVRTVVLAGGVFQNAVLSQGAWQRLSSAGFAVYRQERVPCNDGGLALGQLAVAAAGGGDAA
jgi:hydrogenase maturation protein HypF